MNGKHQRTPKRQPPVDLITQISDEIFEDVAELTGQRCVHAIVWEESLSDALSGEAHDPAQSRDFDLDLYLEGNVAFEAYGVIVFEDPEQAPLGEMDAVAHSLYSLINQGVQLDEPAVDEEGNLVLILALDGAPRLYLVLSAWLLADWDELPA